MTAYGARPSPLDAQANVGSARKTAVVQPWQRARRKLPEAVLARADAVLE